MTLCITKGNLPPLDHGAIRQLPTLPDSGSTTLALDADSAVFVGPCLVTLRANVDLLWEFAASGSPTPIKRLMKGDREHVRIDAGQSGKFRATAAT